MKGRQCEHERVARYERRQPFILLVPTALAASPSGIVFLPNSIVSTPVLWGDRSSSDLGTSFAEYLYQVSGGSSGLRLTDYPSLSVVIQTAIEEAPRRRLRVAWVQNVVRQPSRPIG